MLNPDGYQSALEIILAQLQKEYPERTLTIADLKIEHFSGSGEKLGETDGSEGAKVLFDDMNNYAAQGAYSEIRVKEDTVPSIVAKKPEKPKEILKCLDRNERELKLGDIVGFNNVPDAEGIIKEIGENRAVVFWKDIQKDTPMTFGYVSQHIYFISEGDREALSITNPDANPVSDIRDLMKNPEGPKYTEDDFKAAIHEMESYIAGKPVREYKGGTTFNTYTLSGDCDCPSCNISRMIAEEVRNDEEKAKRWADEAYRAMKTGARSQSAASASTTSVSDVMKKIESKVTSLKATPQPAPKVESSPESSTSSFISNNRIMVENDSDLDGTYIGLNEENDVIANGSKENIMNLVAEYVERTGKLVDIYKFSETVKIRKTIDRRGRSS